MVQDRAIVTMAAKKHDSLVISFKSLRARVTNRRTDTLTRRACPCRSNNSIQEKARKLQARIHDYYPHRIPVLIQLPPPTKLIGGNVT